MKENLFFWGRFVFFLLLSSPVHASWQALFGGTDRETDLPYVGIVSTNGVIERINTDDTYFGIGSIERVDMNQFGIGIIGGQDGDYDTTYFALLTPEKRTKAIQGYLPVGTGQISNVVINQNNICLVTGSQGDYDTLYASYVDANGIAYQIEGLSSTFIPTISITGSALNDNGIGVIGSSNSGDAVITTQNRLLHEVTGELPTGAGQIATTAINNNNLIAIGGVQNSNQAYAALVNMDGVAREITGDFPQGGFTIIYAIGINDSNKILMVGAGGTLNVPYLASVSLNGVAAQITNGDLPVGNGVLNRISINASGKAIIAGTQNGNEPYLGLVSPEGVVSQITGELPEATGSIREVAINDVGIAAAGGVKSNISFHRVGYLALISPTGIATEVTGDLPVGADQLITSVAINLMVPENFGPGNSFGDSLFTLTSSILPNHLLNRQNTFRKSSQTSSPQEISLLVSGKDRVPLSSSKKETSNYCIWTSLFGDHFHQRSAYSQNNWVGGAMLGFDFLGKENVVIGGGAAYAYNYVNFSGYYGHAKVNQELLTVYSSYGEGYFYINGALWGGFYQVDNERHSFGNITSTSNYQGWLFVPHLEMSTPIQKANGRFVIDPFAMFDVANNWQGSLTEKGIAGFNLHVDSEYVGLLRSEVGLRLFEPIELSWGQIVMEEKVSWVNKYPFYAGASEVIFVGSITPFTTEVFSDKTENLTALQFTTLFLPFNERSFYGTINYQGEFNHSSQSHLLSIEVGKNF